MQSERLLQLADFLDTLPPEKWNFGIIAESALGGKCNSAGCAMGWMPSLFHDCEILGMTLVVSNYSVYGYDAAARILGIDSYYADILFGPEYYVTGEKTGPSVVAERLRKVANGTWSEDTDETYCDPICSWPDDEEYDEDEDDEEFDYDDEDDWDEDEEDKVTN